ncbi:hypothetical protein M9458_019222, partial [Cirrhinus mrigala]
MPRRFCRSCKAPLHATDGHGECVSCLGKSHAEAALNKTECPHCEDMSLASLRSRIAFFSERDSAPRALPFSSSQEPVKKKQRGRGSKRSELSELTSAQPPRASASPQREDSPVLFARPDLCPSAVASDLVSFGGSEDDMLDSMSLAASDAEELSGSVNNPAPLPSADTSGPRTGAGMDAELFRVLTRAVDELGLEWSPPEEPSRSLLDEWFLPGRRQAPRQRASPFLPEVHEELTKSWRAPYSACLRTSSSSALTSVDGAEDKGYERLPPLDESVAAHLCPPTAIGWKAKASHPSKPCRTTSALAGRAYTSAGQAASALHSMAILQVFQAKLLAEADKSALDPATLMELRSTTDLALHATKAQAIGRSLASLVVLDKVTFLDVPVSPTGLFGPAVEGFAERFSAAQKTSQAMRHFLPKRSSSAAASGRPKSAPPQQHVKPAPAAAAAASAQPAKLEPRQRSRSARRYPFPKRQGPRPKLVLDPAPPPSLMLAGPTPKRPLLCLQAPRMVPGAEVKVFCVKPVVNTGPVQLAPTQSGVSPCHDGQPLEPILSLATRAEAWQAIPGVSEWVMGIIKRGYSLQFARRHPCFSGVVPTLVVSKDAHVLRSEVMILLEKGAVEVVHPAQSESGFYSRYFLVPKKDGGLRPILDLRHLNRALMKRPFKIITLKQILSHIRPGDWFFSLDLKDAYFHIQIAPHHRRFLRFAFEGVAYQYTVLPFGLSLAPRTFTKCMNAALSSLRQRGIRILNYLDDWLVLPIRRLAASFKIGASHPLKMFQKMLGLMASASPVLELGLLRMRSLQHWLKPRVPSHAWRHGRLRIRVDQACVEALIPWTNSRWMERGVPLGMVCRRKVVMTDASNMGWGALCDGNPAFGLWTKAEAGIHINCLEMLAVCRALHFFLTDLKGHHVLVRSDSMTMVSYKNRQGGLSSKCLFTLVKGLLEWAQLNLCSLRATHVPGRLNQSADMLSRSNVPSGEWTLHPQAVQKIWEVFGKAETILIAQCIIRRAGTIGPRLAQPPPVCFPPDILDSSSTQASQGTETQAASGGPSLEKPALVLRTVPAARSSPLAHSPETGPPLSGERDNMAPPAQAVGPAPLVSGREPVNLSESVLNTISQARAPSTRRLDALKWFVFSAWCSTRGEDSISCDISVILSFLQELLDKGRSPSTLKVYVAAIAASHAPIAGQSVGRNNLVVRFLKGSRRLNPPRPHTIPTWDLSTVLRALKGPPFEPLSRHRGGSGVESALPSQGIKDLFVCFGGRNKGHPVTKKRLSRWIIDAITLAYSSLGLQCPVGAWPPLGRGLAVYPLQKFVRRLAGPRRPPSLGSTTWTSPPYRQG